MSCDQTIMPSFNLIAELVFYGSYHSHPLNQLIHCVFVPLIQFTTFLLLDSCLSPFISDQTVAVYAQHVLPKAGVSFVAPLLPSVTLSCLLYLFYSLYYFSLAPFFIALSFNAWNLLLLLTAQALLQLSLLHGHFASLIVFSLCLHVFSWFIQVRVGHLHYEHRKPALLDSAVQSFLLAPLFVYYETLFYFGFQHKTKNAIQPKIDEKIKQMNKEEQEQKEKEKKKK